MCCSTVGVYQQVPAGISIEKIGRMLMPVMGAYGGARHVSPDRLPARARATFRLRSTGQIAFPLGFGLLFALIVSKTTHIGPKSDPRPPT